MTVNATLFYNLLSPTSWAASSTKSGSDAANAQKPGIARAWASNATGSQQLTADLGSSKTIRGIGVQSVPVSALGFRADNSATPTTSVGSATPAIAGHGVYRCSAAMNVSARYFSAYFASPTALGANAGVYATQPTVFEVGAMYAFGSSITVAADPLLESEIEHTYPQDRISLPNGVESVISRGAPYSRFTLRFRPAAGEDVEQIVRIARSGLCWLNLGVAARPDLQWPVRFVDDSHSRQWRGGLDSVVLTFREVT